MLRPHPRPIKPDSLGEGLRHQHVFFKVPSDSSVQPGVSPHVWEKGLDHRFTADEMETQIRFKAPISYSRSLKIQPPSYAGALLSCPSFP